jgi:cytosine/adenosine deaminase-related metal-dependent hydrolase
MSDRTWYPLGPKHTTARRTIRAAAGTVPVDPLIGPRLALAGRVVTMNNSFKVHADAVVYIDKGRIVDIRPRAQAAPPGFDATPVVETGGTLYPGLIELHNHLSYNILPLWSPVPKRFEHRGLWPNHKDYRPLVSGPMTVLGSYKDAQGRFPFVPALIRYVEAKCLLGGVTTTQGVRLASNSGIQRFYRGIVRNVEQTDEPDLPEAQARIPDIDARDARSFLARLNKEDSCLLLHLSEGLSRMPDSVARKHFLALEVAPGQWALNKMFAGIHAAGLRPEDFDVLAEHGSSIVWSPLSNLLLYGGTARVDAARRAGVTIALGSDWSPTGSKNLLGEMKVAWLHSQQTLNGLLSARDIVAMATRDAARVLKWDKALGTLSRGMRADLLVLDGTPADPYLALLKAKETDLRLVMINGIARYGVPSVTKALAPTDQSIRVGGQSRRLYLKQDTGDPDVAPVSLAKARTTLKGALAKIAKLAKDLEMPRPKMRAAPLDARSRPEWTIALDEICDCGVEFAPRLAFNGPRDFSGVDRAPRLLAARAPKLSTVLKPIELDPLTVADDPNFLDRIEQQPNIPAELRVALRDLY